MTTELPTIAISIFDLVTGQILKSGQFSDLAEAALNCPEGTAMIEGEYDTNAYSIVDGAAVLRPVIPNPVQEGHLLTWPDPPLGFAARVYDTWTVPPHLLVDTPLSAPDCGLLLVEGGNTYKIDLTADFPWVPTSLEVST